MSRTLAALFAALLVAAPAYADTAPSQTSAPTVTPDYTFGVLPLPLVAIYAIGEATGLPAGPFHQELAARGGYVWATYAVYDPNTPQMKVLTPLEDANYWNFYADWGLDFTRQWTVFLDGYVMGGNVTSSPSYDPDLVGGVSTSWGPELQYSTLDDTGFPTRGALVQLEYAPGYHWGATSFGYQRAWGQAQRFFSLGGERTIALRGVFMAAWPKLAWADKFAAGGAFYLRGYDWNRFTGDRLLSGSVEYRDLFWRDMFGLGERIGLPFGLAWEAYVDGGRAWESSRGVPFLSDLRFGGGTGLMLTLDKTPVGRLELNASPEGFYPTVGFLAAF